MLMLSIQISIWVATAFEVRVHYWQLTFPVFQVFSLKQIFICFDQSSTERWEFVQIVQLSNTNKTYSNANISSFPVLSCNTNLVSQSLAQKMPEPIELLQWNMEFS